MYSASMLFLRLFVCVSVSSWPSRPGCDRDRAVWALTDRGCLHQPIVCHSLIMFIDLWQKHNLMEWGEGGRGGDVGVEWRKGEDCICVIVTVWLALKNRKILQKWLLFFSFFWF